MQGPFEYKTIKEAWDVFNSAASVHLARLVRELAKENPRLRTQIKSLKHRDYCARLLYILNMFAVTGVNEDGEFDLDWAMLMAKPLAAAQARQSFEDLIKLGFIQDFEMMDEESQNKLDSLEDDKQLDFDSDATTEFDFD